MADYIERNAVLKFVCGSIPHFSGETTMACVRRAIKEAPAANLTPCDVCAYNPPSSGDGKPCTICPAMAKGD